MSDPTTEFGVQNTPWATEGRKVTDAESMRDAMEIAKLDFGVETSPVHMRTGELTDDAIHDLLLQHKPRSIEDYRTMLDDAMGQVYSSVNSHNVIRRTDNNDVFGVCGNRWEPLQNVDAFDWFQPALDEGLVKLHTVGKLGGGKKIWILAELCEDPVEIVPGDEVAKFMLLGNGHDGGTAIFIGFTPIRVWCANQFPQLKRNAATRMIRLRHSRHTKTSLEKLRDVISFANAEFNATAEQYRELANLPINAKDLEKYVKVLFCDKVEATKPLAKLSTRKRNQVEEIITLTETGIGLQGPNIRGTWYSAFNGVNQYLNYNAGRTANNRLNSLWFGQNRNMNEDALKLATEMALAI